MSVSRRRALLAIVLFAGVLSIGPLIAPVPDGGIGDAGPVSGVGDAVFGGALDGAADVVDGELTDGTGVPQPAARSWRLLGVALLVLGLGVVIPATGSRPVERRPLGIRLVVALLPDRRGPPSTIV